MLFPSVYKKPMEKAKKVLTKHIFCDIILKVSKDNRLSDELVKHTCRGEHIKHQVYYVALSDRGKSFFVVKISNGGNKNAQCKGS